MGMGKYKYNGLNADGKKVEGEVEAQNLRDAKKQLRRQGIRARKITEPSILDLDLGQLMVEKGLAAPFTTRTWPHRHHRIHHRRHNPNTLPLSVLHPLLHTVGP